MPTTPIILELAGAILGVSLIVLGFRWDRSKGRRRCPKCWYDMSATPSLTCPECGRTVRIEKRLFRTRPKRWVACLGFAFLVASASVWARLRWSDARRWREYLPTSVLIELATRDDEWADLELLTRVSAADEFTVINRSALSTRQWQRLARPGSASNLASTAARFLDPSPWKCPSPDEIEALVCLHTADGVNQAYDLLRIEHSPELGASFKALERFDLLLTSEPRPDAPDCVLQLLIGDAYIYLVFLRNNDQWLWAGQIYDSGGFWESDHLTPSAVSTLAGRRFLKLQRAGHAMSGSTKRETWFEVTPGEIHQVLTHEIKSRWDGSFDFLPFVAQTSDPVFVDAPDACTVSFIHTVCYAGYVRKLTPRPGEDAGSSVPDLVVRSAPVVYNWDARRACYSFDARRSQWPVDPWGDRPDFHPKPATFCQLNQQALTRLATSNDPALRSWVADFIKKCPDSRSKSAIQRALEATK